MTYKHLGDQEISTLVSSALQQPNAIKRAKIYDQVLRGTFFVIDRLTKRYVDLPSYEDLQQIGRYTLYQAILTFNPDKCPKFYGWAVRWIKKNIAIAAYKSKRYFELNDFSEDATALASTMMTEKTPEDLYIDSEDSLILWKVINKAGAVGSQVLIDLYVDDVSEAQCASNLGISRCKLQNIKNLALNMLRDNVELERTIT